MKRLFNLLIFISLFIFVAHAEERYDSLTNDTIRQEKKIKSKKLSFIKDLFKNFNDYDERYIEPQHYLFTAMLQTTYTYDFYTLRSGNVDKQSISFAPDGSFKLGPYFGWKWAFAGYTFTLNASSYSKIKTEWDLSFYTARIGIDLFYRRSGNDYKLRNAYFGRDINTTVLHNVSFDGVKAGVTGLNLYYIFNNRHFSYPAAFAQSTCQKISCGSWMAGIGYMKNSFSLDYEKLQTIIDEKMAPQKVRLDSGLQFKEASYEDFNISGGYAYNLVFAKNFLFCASGQLALSYKKNSGRTGDTDSEEKFSFYKILPNLIGRFALVYNNTRWYAGFSAIIRSNNYMDSRFAANNTYGSMNLYVGYNFALRKRYRKAK